MIAELDEARQAAALAVTAGTGHYVSAFVDEYAGNSPHLVVGVLERLRQQLATTAEAHGGSIDAARDVRLRADWVDTTARRVLLLTMGSPS